MPLKGELARIEDGLRQAYDGDCWHGPPLRQVLADVTAAMAASRPPGLAHSIWGLVIPIAVMRTGRPSTTPTTPARSPC